jgi:hypothetical protein
MTEIGQVTSVIINYRTPDLLDRAIGTFRQHYPDAPLLLIDNGSRDTASESVLHTWKGRHPACTDLLFNSANLHHGPAIDQAMHHASTPFLFFLDSDCEVTRGGVIEQMYALLTASPTQYAIGKLTCMDRRGFDLPVGSARAVPYIRPICMLLQRNLYLSLPGAEKHGTPLLRNMQAAAARGLSVVDFPIDEFIIHKGRGTAGRFGYGLGWRGVVNYFLHKLHL